MQNNTLPLSLLISAALIIPSFAAAANVADNTASADAMLTPSTSDTMEEDIESQPIQPTDIDTDTAQSDPSMREDPNMPIDPNMPVNPSNGQTSPQTPRSDTTSADLPNSNRQSNNLQNSNLQNSNRQNSDLQDSSTDPIVINETRRIVVR